MNRRDFLRGSTALATLPFLPALAEAAPVSSVRIVQEVPGDSVRVFTTNAFSTRTLCFEVGGLNSNDHYFFVMGENEDEYYMVDDHGGRFPMALIGETSW